MILLGWLLGMGTMWLLVHRREAIVAEQARADRIRTAHAMRRRPQWRH